MQEEWENVPTDHPAGEISRSDAHDAMMDYYHNVYWDKASCIKTIVFSILSSCASICVLRYIVDCYARNEGVNEPNPIVRCCFFKHVLFTVLVIMTQFKAQFFFLISVSMIDTLIKYRVYQNSDACACYDIKCNVDIIKVTWSRKSILEVIEESKKC